jgi:hypothetical protein
MRGRLPDVGLPAPRRQESSFVRDDEGALAADRTRSRHTNRRHDLRVDAPGASDLSAADERVSQRAASAAA